MRARAGMVAALAGGVCVWVSASSARAGGPNAIAPATAVLPVAAVGDEPKYEYVGAAKCKKCHLAEHKSWAETKMAKAMDSLKPDHAVEAKSKHNLDPKKDYSTDETCLPCHVTGFKLPGGYAVPDAADAKAVKAADKLAGVGCEACHGPGSKYIEVFEEIFKSKRKYKVEELYAVGLHKIEAASCTTCHSEKGPTDDPATTFDFEKMKKDDKQLHSHTEMKQREG